MMEIKRTSHWDIHPIGSLWVIDDGDRWMVYDLYENYETNEYVEIWIKMK